MTPDPDDDNQDPARENLPADRKRERERPAADRDRWGTSPRGGYQRSAGPAGGGDFDRDRDFTGGGDDGASAAKREQEHDTEHGNREPDGDLDRGYRFERDRARAATGSIDMAEEPERDDRPVDARDADVSREREPDPRR